MHQEAEQVTNRLVGSLQVQADILLDAVKQLFTAGQNDLRGLPIVKMPSTTPVSNSSMVNITLICTCRGSRRCSGRSGLGMQVTP
jgi:hypothetical protein